MTAKAGPAGGRGAGLLFEGAEWNFDLLRRVHDGIEEVALGELGLDVYRNQIEVITAEQMLDAYASVGMPLMYRHWSFGKHFVREETLYRKGAQALAYELVINSNPCVCYVMEENTITMQALVIAHAAFGHNHFFKNNYLFKQWTDADTVLDELAHAKRFVQHCEDRYGIDAVESVLDAAHALMRHGVSRYAPSRQRDERDAAGKARARAVHEEATYNDLWRTVPKKPSGEPVEEADSENGGDGPELGLPEENLLLFLERFAPKLENWQRELIAIVRRNAQYFYPQRQTKLMNEGCATFVHYEILNRLYEAGRIGEGSILEFLHSHSSVVTQPDFDDRRFSGINPYALGFAMMRDIQRICEEPTAEDRDWFPGIAGNGDALATLRSAWADYRDESFVLQYLSPKVIRDFRMFALSDDTTSTFMRVDAIHEEEGYRDVRRALARQYDPGHQDPDIQVVEANLKGSRRLVLKHVVRDGKRLERKEAERVLAHVARLWGYRVRLIEVDAETGTTYEGLEALAMPW
ncbi:MAG: SpoVR family protein [Rhizobiales bacterium]|nr:SpoVR family protein [Hyphomicrobiales bacterium]